MNMLTATLRKVGARVRSLMEKPLPPVAASQVRIDPIAQSELAQLQQVFPAAHDQSYAQALTQQERGDTSVYAAWLQGVPVGVAYVCWPGHRTPSVRERWPGVPEIYKVQVARAQRSRGIGALIFKRVEADALDRGCKSMGLGVHAHNMRARSLYLRLGYVADPVTFFDEYDELDDSGKLVHQKIATVFMSKLLAARGA
jgi:GNAT superfamily N-acetyltransferase